LVTKNKCITIHGNMNVKFRLHVARASDS